ncbi:unnamed protein product [Heligmosomoides polygyrus]|uniref:Ovule protein n=1 Tax=Heligmosomoides polygyrus TaxID=6339 RepID=A0A183FBB1_HELPZ|nr:unnamed protein product [Heligmosomoides polygyrus]
MVQCATNWSIPPKVCTNCWEQYIAFKQVEYETKHLVSFCFFILNRGVQRLSILYGVYHSHYFRGISWSQLSSYSPYGCA